MRMSENYAIGNKFGFSYIKSYDTVYIVNAVYSTGKISPLLSFFSEELAKEFAGKAARNNDFAVQITTIDVVKTKA